MNETFCLLVCIVLSSFISHVSEILFSKRKIVYRISIDHVVLLGCNVGQIWRNQGKIHRCSAAFNWSKCVFCQENTSEKRECRANSNQRNRGAGYIKLQKDLESFYEAGELDLDLAELDEGRGGGGWGLLRHFRSIMPHDISHATLNTTQRN